MAKDTDTYEHATDNDRVTLITRGNTPPPNLSRTQLRALVALAQCSIWLEQARDRQKQAQGRATELRDQIIAEAGGIYGFKVRFPRRTIRTLISPQYRMRYAPLSDVMDWLGEHSTEVIKGLRISPVILEHPKKLRKLREALGKNFDTWLEPIIDRDALKELIDAGELEEPPESLVTDEFRHNRVLVKITK